MDWITKNIAIGDYIDSKKAQEGDFDAILCLVSSCCNIADTRFNILNVSLIDAAGNDRDKFEEATNFIDKIVSRNEKILVHCYAGRSRSVSIVARYLMISKNIASKEALSIIERKHKICLSNGINEILLINP